MKSQSSQWEDDCALTIDGGTVLSGITDMIDNHVISSDQLIHKDTQSNAWLVLSRFIKSFCITHPHIDHIAGLVLNSAGLTPDNPKTIAGLPGTIEALKAHVFNGLIWPNLTNEGQDAAHVLDLFGMEPFEFCPRANNLSVAAYPVSHGPSHTKRKLESHIFRWAKIFLAFL